MTPTDPADDRPAAPGPGDEDHPAVRPTSPAGRWASGGRLRRRVSSALVLAVALLSFGGLYTVFAPQPQTAQAQEDPALVRQGEELFNNQCITCHGANLQGVDGRGPSVIGAGEAAVYFQVSTGRMPLQRQEAQAPQKPVAYSPEEIDALAAYVQANGGGPVTPEVIEDGNPARGGELFRLNCSSCHNFVAQGGALSAGKYAPAIEGVNRGQIYAALLHGPQNMPKFSDRQLSPEEKADIISYIESVQLERNNPGGYALGGFGPISEGLVAWIVGIAAIVAITLWIGAQA